MDRWDMPQLKNNGIKVVDLFCGAGIGASGVKLAGFDIVYAIDNNKYAVDTYNKNIGKHAICADIKDISAIDIPTHDIMIATPVCKSFSFAGNGKGVHDEKYGDLSYHFFRLLKDKMPKAFFFENVNGITSGNNKEFFYNFVEMINEIGYKVTYDVLNCYDYGVPQHRKRLFMVGIRNDIEGDFIFPEKVSNKKSIRYAIGDLPQPKVKVVGKEDIISFDSGISTKPLVPNQFAYLELGFSPRYKSRNRQRQWDEGSFTIVSEARQLPLYPSPENYDIRKMDEYNIIPPRRFTVRECLRLQTVPDWFTFDSDITKLKKQYERCSGIPSLMSYKIMLKIKEAIAK